jgi:uncharacterized Rmd1/YagE family protein
MRSHAKYLVASLRFAVEGHSSLRRWTSSAVAAASSVAAAAVAQPPAPSKGSAVMVKAYYLARGIDVLRVYNNVYRGSRQEFQSKSLTVTLNSSLNQYISIYAYGPVVLFNIPNEDHGEHLRKIQEAGVVSPIADGLQHTESFKVIIHDQLDKPSVIKAEHVNIRALDTKNITIVGTIMAQTVSLDYYADTVDRMLESFMKMNYKIEEGGNFDALDKKGLYKLVASNNTVIANVLSKLGIFEGTDAAWENSDYHYTWELLRKDFELDYRFKDLSMKLDIIKDNSRFFLEILQNQNSNRLEWMIIFLISAELGIGIAGLVSGHL